MRKLIFLENDTGGRLLLTTDINDDLLDCPKAEILDTGHSRQITVDNRRLDSPNHHSTANFVGYTEIMSVTSTKGYLSHLWSTVSIALYKTRYGEFQSSKVGKGIMANDTSSFTHPPTQVSTCVNGGWSGLAQICRKPSAGKSVSCT